MKRVLLVTVLGLTSCLFAFSQSDVRKNLKPKVGKSLIYVVRPHDFAHVLKCYISVDDVTEGDVEGDQFICFSVSPENHYLQASGENHTQYSIDCKADSTYYYKASLQFGGKTMKISLTKINEIDAKKLMIDYDFGKLNRKPD